MEYIRDLTDVSKDDVRSAGSKGANLGELVQMGLPVPPGFVVLTSAYQSFIEANTLQPEIERLTGQACIDDPLSIEQSSIALRNLFEQGILPEELRQAIVSAYEEPGLDVVAVRSSATAEDLPGASFAGQYETYLNVQTVDEVLKAVRKCWSSLWTPRALSYRARQEFDVTSVSLAVIVQQMVPANTSGVLFTINPVTGEGDEIVINATCGLGEALVSGQVTPDVVIAEKESGRIKQIEPGKQREMTTVPSVYAINDTAVAVSMRQTAVLSPEHVAQLTQLGQRIETHFGVPQDIEWAIADEHIWLVQARPVTTHAAKPVATQQGIPIPPGDDSWDREKDLPPQPFDLWTRTNVGENLPFPITPLTGTNFSALFKLNEDAAKPGQKPVQAARRIYGRLYFNEGAIVHSVTEEFGLPASFIDKMWGSRRRGKQQVSEKFRPLRLLCKLPTMLRGGFDAPKKGPKHTPAQFFAQIDQWVNPFMQQDLSKLDDRALWAAGLPVWSERGQYAFTTNLRISIPSGIMYALLERIVKWWTGRKELAQELVTGPTGVYSAEIGPALWRMAQAVKQAKLQHILLDNNPTTALELLRTLPEGQPLIEQLEHFLARHGHRCPNELELRNPRWAEAPEQVIELVTHYLQADESIDPGAAEERQRQCCVQATATVEAKLDPLRRTIFRSILKRAQRAVTVRDNSRYYMSKFFFPMRKLYAELGRRWTERGWLKQSDDIFFLTAAEIQAIIEVEPAAISSDELQTRCALRRLAYEYWMTVLAPDAIDADGTSIIDEEGITTVLKGIAASSGRVRGRARVVQNVHEAMRLKSGDILVTQATDPGWTPVFPLVSGIVLEIGGQLSHGAIIAREYAVPAVVNVQGAMLQIKNGQTIEVDGTRGLVYLDQNAEVPN